MRRRAVTIGASILAVGAVLSGCSAAPLSWTSMSRPLTEESVGSSGSTSGDTSSDTGSGTSGDSGTRTDGGAGASAAAAGSASADTAAATSAPASTITDGEVSAITGGDGGAVTPGDAPAVAAAPGDLDTGSTTHQLSAGADQLVVDYWTTQDPTTWTAATQPVVQLSAHLEGTGVVQKSLVTGFSATGVGADGARVELTRDTGSSVITRGFSYGNAFVMPVAAEGARRTGVTLQWDLMVETSKGSGQFYRQTVIDTLDIALAATPSAASSASSAR